MDAATGADPGPGPQPIVLQGLGGAATDPTLYDRAGGHETFERLTSHFYARVAVDPVLRPMYPDHEWAAAARRLMMFLEQFWGGPTTYSEERGHPRLRQRHAGFRIDETARVAWLTNMRGALDDLGLAPEIDAELWRYLKTAAAALVNTPD